MTINITKPAQQYLKELLAKHESKDASVRIFVNSPGSSSAETCLAYCLPGENLPEDEPIDGLLVPVWLDKPSLPYLEDAKVDYKQDDLGGGQLTIVAPNARLPRISKDSPISERIEYVLQNEINPNLASHGGFVRLVEYQEDASTAVLQFGGGCQGCGMVDFTLKQGVETSLKERIPEIAAVTDATDHSDSSEAYYK